MDISQVYQWVAVLFIGCAGGVLGYYWLELFTKASVGWALACSLGWIGFSVLMGYGAMFPHEPDKLEHILNYLLFADKVDRGDFIQMAAYIVIIWCGWAVLINRLLRKKSN